ncbi:MAG TPA: hypothetical protein VIE39_04410 [Thermoanaerobaculia bacterium]
MNGRARPHAPEEALADFPLLGAADAATPVTEPIALPAAVSPAAALAPRLRALAADGAAVLLVVAACLLLAVALRGRGPRPEGLAWAGGFALLLSFVATVLSLVLFGRTLGMALSGLTAGGPARHLAPGEAARRWIGTAVTAAGLGFPLLWTARNPESPTPADRLSGRPLVAEETGLS